MILQPWYGCRQRHLKKLSIRAAEDIIRNCRTRADDATFAAKYGLNRAYVGDIRMGRHWKWLRAEIQGSKHGTR
jgi:hypothetical protein